MSKTSPQFTCTNCDAQYAKWTGRCLECGKWGTIVESQKSKVISQKSDANNYAPLETKNLSEIKGQAVSRIKTTISELDQVLGGGLVPGSLILLGGEPGIGKSTLAMQVALAVPNTIYISAEESIEQIKLRSDRLGITAKAKNLRLANSTAVENIVSTIQQEKPILAIIDSIQTVSSAEVDGEAGGVTQVRASTVKLMEAAKSSGTAVILIGHITKEGSLAGPKTLEHLVDVVLTFEGDRHHGLRILRGVKNRFGGTDEVGMFEMSEIGLSEVPNPSSILLGERGDNMPGSILTCLMEGSRPILVEVQALINKTVFGYPVRKSSGFDLNRLHVLTAVLQRRAGLNLAQYDIHVNIVGGVNADEPGTDLAMCLAVASAYKDKALGNDLAVFGEVGLGGEVRSIRFIEKRLKECEQIGIKRVIIPKLKKLPKTSLKIIEVRNIQELITHA